MLIPKGDKSNLNTLEPGCCFSLLVVLHGFDDRCPSMESYFRPPLFEHQRRSRTNGISKLSVRTWSKANYDENLLKLQTALAAAGVATQGLPVFARYNGPMTPFFMRRNEIWLALK
jgi:hypothetical protein